MNDLNNELIEQMAAEALDVASVAADPMAQFRRWYAQARSARIPREDAMTLATLGPDGAPAARIVLYKDLADSRLRRTRLSLSSRTTRATRASSLRATRGPPSSSTGSPPPGRCASRAPWKNSPKSFLTPISPPARAPANSARGRRPRAAWSPPAPHLEAKERALETEYAGREVPRPPHWGGYVLKASHHRVLAAPRQPPPRPRALHAGGGWRVAYRKAGAVENKKAPRFQPTGLTIENPFQIKTALQPERL